MEEDDFEESSDEEAEDEEAEEIEVLEFALSDEEIDELISKLQELKLTKKFIDFEIDEENGLVIHHEEDAENADEDEDVSEEEE